MIFELARNCRIILNQDFSIYRNRGKNGKTLTVITHYTDSDNEEPKDIFVDFQRKGRYEIYLLDKDNDGSLIGITEDLHLTIDANMCIMIKEI